MGGTADDDDGGSEGRKAEEGRWDDGIYNRVSGSNDRVKGREEV